MSSRKKSPAAYQDVKQVLDIAVAKPNLRYECKTPGDAISFRQRCYSYMKLLREQNDEILGIVPGHRSETPYDALYIQLGTYTAGEFIPSRSGNTLRFSHQHTGKLIDPETGEEIKIENSVLTGTINSDLQDGES